MDYYLFLVTAHIFGAILGVGGITFAEIFYFKSARDNVIDETESSFLRTTYFVLRMGTILLVLSGFGFLVYYRLIGSEELLYNSQLWAKLTIVIVIAFNAILLQARKIPTWLGSPISLVSWYIAMFLGIFRNVEMSYFQAMIIYIAMIVFVAFVLDYIKRILNIKI
ncbi:hypothetical protein KAJ41_01265 [Candidatus Parcubacteria bacterium]|nr:hypothetical protein [Candidatus Parcubacteria bacterium]